MNTLLLPFFALLTAAAPGPGAPAARGADDGGATAGAALLARAAEDLDRLHKALKDVLSRVEDARDERDLVKLLCADEKLSRIKVLVAVAESADVALAEAVSSRDEAAAIEGSKIAIARRKADAVRSEAAACIGQLAYEVGGRTTVVVEEAEALPELGATRGMATPTPSADPYRTDFGIPSSARR